MESGYMSMTYRFIPNRFGGYLLDGNGNFNEAFGNLGHGFLFFLVVGFIKGTFKDFAVLSILSSKETSVNSFSPSSFLKIRKEESCIASKDFRG